MARSKKPKQMMWVFMNGDGTKDYLMCWLWFCIDDNL